MPVSKNKWVSVPTYSLLLVLAISALSGCSSTNSGNLLATHYNSNEIESIKAAFDNLNQDEFSFIALGDNRDGNDILEYFINQINKIRPAPLFIVDSGDLVPLGMDSQYKEFVRTISKSKIPVLCLPGNHDYLFNGKERYIKYFGAPYYYFDLRDFRFIMLDNADTLDDEQLSWLGKLLTEGKKCFIFMHKPPPVGKWATYSFEKNADNFLKLIKRENGVLACFFGHIHGYSEAEFNGVKLFISGGAGAPLYFWHGFGKTVETVYHYMIINVRKDGSWRYEVKRKGKD